jgi:hypothetical protein
MLLRICGAIHRFIIHAFMPCTGAISFKFVMVIEARVGQYQLHIPSHLLQRDVLLFSEIFLPSHKTTLYINSQDQNSVYIISNTWHFLFLSSFTIWKFWHNVISCHLTNSHTLNFYIITWLNMTVLLRRYANFQNEVLMLYRSVIYF